MARPASRGAEEKLRQYLLRQAWDFREMYGNHLPGAWEQLSLPVDQLARGEAYRLYRWQLPDDHPQRYVGGLKDRLVLNECDELIEACA